MKMIDPTYLRTIHDGLLSGVMHKDNASALPMGLVGMYEEALPASVNVNERKKFLEFFAVWALLKKEVSTEFVTRLLENWTDEQVIDYIAQYSKLFNNPVSGKYVLYHERLRSFILQKVSADHFKKCNEHIIHQCQLALHAKTDDEWERYALEFLSTHLLIQAIDCNDGETLKSLSYNTTHWNRQVEISKGFEWSKRMLNEMKLWASKYDDGEVIECALSKLDLHHFEQNDASRIIELVAANDIDSALQRIEKFGGIDKEGLERKFIIYMLCLMELTLLDSRDRPFRQESIEKLLKHLNENFPADHSLLIWRDLFPSYIVFLTFCELKVLGINYVLLIDFSIFMKKNWISLNGPYSDLQIEILQSWITAEISYLVDSENQENHNSNFDYLIMQRLGDLNEVAVQMIKQGKIEEGDDIKERIIRMYNDYFDADRSNDIRRSYYSKGSFNSERNSWLIALSVQFAKMGQYERSFRCIDSIEISPQKNRNDRDAGLSSLAIVLAEVGRMDEAQRMIEEVQFLDVQIETWLMVATVVHNQGEKEESEICFEKALKIFSSKPDGYFREELLEKFADLLIGQEKLEDAVIFIKGYESLKDKRRFKIIVARELFGIGNVVESTELVKLLLDDIKRLQHLNDRIDSLLLMYVNLRIHEDHELFSLIRVTINSELNFQSLNQSENFNFRPIVRMFLKYKLFDFAHAIAQQIADSFQRDVMLWDITKEMISCGLLEGAQKLLKDIGLINVRRAINSDIMIGMGNRKDFEKSIELMHSALDFSNGMDRTFFKYYYLMNIAVQKSQVGDLNESKQIISKFIPKFITDIALRDVSVQLAKNGTYDEAKEIALGILDVKDRIQALIALVDVYIINNEEELVNRNLDGIYESIKDLNSTEDRIICLSLLSTCYYRVNNKDRSNLLLKSVLDLALELEDKGDSNSSRVQLSKVVVECVNQEKFDLALKILENKCFTEISMGLRYCVSELVKKNFVKQAFLVTDRFDDRLKFQLFGEVVIGLLDENNFEATAMFLKEIEIDDLKDEKTIFVFNLVRIALVSIEKSDFSFLENFFAHVISSDSLTEDLRDEVETKLEFVIRFLIKQNELKIAFRFVRSCPLIKDNSKYFEKFGSYMIKEGERIISLESMIENCDNDEINWVINGYVQAYLDNGLIIDDSELLNILKRENVSEIVINKLLFQKAIKEVFFSNPTSLRLKRLNRTLSIDWAVDIKNSLNAN